MGSNIISGNRDQHWFNVTLGHNCHVCHRWIKIGERAYYMSSGDCGIVYCEKDANNVGILCPEANEAVKRLWA